MDQLLEDYMRVINAKDDEIHRYMKLVEGLRVKYSVSDLQLRKKICALKKHLDAKQEALAAQQTQLHEQASAMTQLTRTLADVQNKLDHAQTRAQTLQGSHEESAAAAAAEAAKQLQLCRESADLRVHRAEQRYRQARRRLARLRRRSRERRVAHLLCQKKQHEADEEEKRRRQQHQQIKQQQRHERQMHECASQRVKLRREMVACAQRLRAMTRRCQAYVRDGRALARLRWRCACLSHSRARAAEARVHARKAAMTRCPRCEAVVYLTAHRSPCPTQQKESPMCRKDDVCAAWPHTQRPHHTAITNNSTPSAAHVHDPRHKDANATIEPLEECHQTCPTDTLRHDGDAGHTCAARERCEMSVAKDTTDDTAALVGVGGTFARLLGMTRQQVRRCAEVMAMMWTAREKASRRRCFRRRRRRDVRVGRLRRMRAIQGTRQRELYASHGHTLLPSLHTMPVETTSAHDTSDASAAARAAAALCAHGDAVEAEAQRTAAAVAVRLCPVNDGLTGEPHEGCTSAADDVANTSRVAVAPTTIIIAESAAKPAATVSKSRLTFIQTPFAAETLQSAESAERLPYAAGVSGGDGGGAKASLQPMCKDRDDDPLHAEQSVAMLTEEEEEEDETAAINESSLRARYKWEKEKLLSRERAVAEQWGAITQWLSRALLAMRTDMYRTMLLLWADSTRTAREAAAVVAERLPVYGGRIDENAVSVNSVNDGPLHTRQEYVHCPAAPSRMQLCMSHKETTRTCAHDTHMRIVNTIAESQDTNHTHREDRQHADVNRTSHAPTLPRSKKVSFDMRTSADASAPCVAESAREGQLRRAQEMCRGDDEKLVALQRSVGSAQHEVHRLCAQNAELRAQLMHHDDTQAMCDCLTERLEQSRRDAELREAALAERVAQLEACRVELSTWRERCANAESLRAIAEGSLHECQFRERGLRFRLEAKTGTA